ncbi:unnamed protein product [Nezara viridula]|uniref:Odorant receptor n=1 Tax=Nezara viridula TaxID=85310 RepID=A0A9P0MR08_NEZVI|nr:unnamed protein product [Nezara viridula]
MGFQDAIGDSDVINGLSIKFLKLLGMWNAINKYRTTGKRAVVTKIHVIGSLLITVPYVVCQLQSFFNIEFDVQKLTFVYLHPLPAASLCCRILIFWYRMESICRLYNLLRKDFFNIPHEISGDVRRIYEKVSRLSNLCCTFVFLLLGGVEILYLFFPGMSVDYIQHHTGSMAAVKTGRKKIFGGWYPVPMSEYTEELSSVYNPMVTITLGIGIIVLIIAAVQILLSSDLHFAIYRSEWYKADVEFRKAAQMLMVGTRRNVNLTALGMYPVNLETLEALPVEQRNEQCPSISVSNQHLHLTPSLRCLLHLIQLGSLPGVPWRNQSL